MAFLTSTVLAVVGLGLTIFGSVKQQRANKKAGERAEEANRLTREAEKKQQKIADLQTLRSKRAAAREAQIRRADVTSNAQNAGVNTAGGSTVPGARGSISTQLNTNLSFLDRSSALNTQTTSLLGQASDLRSQGTSTLGSAIAGFGGTIFANSKKLGGIIDTGFSSGGSSGLGTPGASAPGAGTPF